MIVPVDETVMWMLFIGFILSAALAAVFGILTTLLFALTPARIWLKARLRNKPIVEARRRDRKIDPVIGETYIQGLVTTKDYGCFIVDPDSVYTSKKGGVAVLPVNAEVGITLSPKVLQIIDGLKRMGIDNIEDAMALNDVWGVCQCGYEGIMEFEQDVDGRPLIVGGGLKLFCPLRNKEEIHGIQERVEKESTGIPASPAVPAEQTEPAKPVEPDSPPGCSYRFSDKGSDDDCELRGSA